MTFHSLVDLFRFNSQEHASASLTYMRNGETPDRSLTHAQLSVRAQQLAGWLIEKGYSGQRALLVFPPGLEFIEAFMACMIAKVIAVPVATAPLAGDKNKVKRMLSILRDCQPKLVMGVTQTIDKAPLFVEENPDFQHLAWISLDTFDQWEQYGNVKIAPPSGSDLAFLQYTSGSTAHPKGVMLSHKNILHNLAQWDLGLGHDHDSKMVCWVPHFHDLGLLYGVLFPLYKGISSYLLPAASIVQKPSRWLHVISTYRGTHSMGPNFIYDLCTERISDEECQGMDLSSWRMALNAAEPIRAETLHKFNEKFAPYGLSPNTMTAAYGLAESTCIVTGQNWNKPMRSLRLSATALSRNQVVPAKEGEAFTELVACGSPDVDSVLKIVDPVTFAECAADGIGEIWVRCDSVSSGYWNRAEENQRTFGAKIQGDPQEHAYLRTGDMGFLHEGEVFTTGRIKDMMIVRGENYYPQDAEWEIEHAHPAFKPSCCAVFSIDRDNQEKVVVVQELIRHYDKWPFEEMYAAVRRAIGSVYDLPIESIVLIRPNTTSKTSSGKIQRAASKAAYLNDGLQVIARWDRTAKQAEQLTAKPAPRTTPAIEEISTYLIQRITEIASLSPGIVNPTRPFAEYGLGSLDSTMLAEELAKKFHIDVLPTAFYDHPSIRQLAEYLTLPREQQTAKPAQIAHDDTIAVVGLACRFPGADNAQAFWSLLSEGRCAPNMRTENDGSVRYGGFIDNIASFDNDFFSVTRREASCLDPQQRIAMEVAWHAMEDAGIKPADLAGSNTGVFLGASSFDYGSLQLNEAELDAYSCQGSVLAVIANRLAYQFDLRGPSFVVDTACSSGLTAVHLACRSLRESECNVALAGATNVLLAQDWDIALTKAGMLAPDGLCKTFDASANGYVRGEGCGIVVLKRYADALRDGDRVYGVILGTAINQDGRSNGLTAPNGNAQEALLRTALGKAGVNPSELNYIEAHGTGTSLGDPIECAALRRVLGEREEPCLVGSVKASIGHLEAAAGIASLIKTMLALHHNAIPAQQHFKKLNPLIDLGNALSIPHVLTEWKRPQSGRRCASVSAFGFSGTNACAVVGDGPQVQAAASPTLPSALPFVLTARDQAALQRLAARHLDHLATLSTDEWPHMLYTAACRRSVQAARFATVVDSPAALASRLQALSHAGDSSAASNAPTRIAFVYSGQGIPLAGVGRDLYECVPAFRDALNKCDAILEPILGKTLYALLYEDKAEEELTRPGLAQPIQFSLQYALTQAFLAFGVRPDIVMGHSLGEYAALVTAGAMSLDVALRLVIRRGEFAENFTPQGAMASIFADEATVLNAIGHCKLPIDLAAINGKHHCVVAGTPDAIATFCSYLTTENIAEYRKLAVARAYHSALIDPIVGPYTNFARECNFFTPHTKLISNVSGALWPSEQRLEADYLARHLREPVRFTDSLETLVSEQATIAIEIGSKPVLCTIAQAHLDNRGPRWIPTLRHNGDDVRALLDCLAQAFTAGANVNWQALFAGNAMRTVQLPAYPFELRNHWYQQRAQNNARSAAGTNVRMTAETDQSETIITAPTDIADLSIADGLAQLLARLLHVTPAEINKQAYFLDLGVDSIILMEFTRLTNVHYSAQFTIGEIFERYPSIDLVAQCLADRVVSMAALP
jgi:acyl transferase domain-containing protein/acyl-CoA synthetase (AMP-forming)/AMP-acid ligase II